MNATSPNTSSANGEKTNEDHQSSDNRKTKKESCFDLKVLEKQISALPGDEVVQISASVLTSLLSSMGTMKRQINDLQIHTTLIDKQKTNVLYDISTIQSYNGVQFGHFPRLHVEVRRMIWQAELDRPKIVPMSISHDQVYMTKHEHPVLSILHGCRESRQVVSDKLDIPPDRYMSTPVLCRSLMENSSDTVWRFDDRKDKPRENRACVDECITRGSLSGHIALPYELWYENHSGLGDLAATLDLLRAYGVKSTTLVIGTLNPQER